MRWSAFALVSALGSLAASGCSYPYYGDAGPPPGRPHGGYSDDDHRGPPPHAPAYGYYRHRPRPHVELVFDDGLGVYTVAGYPDHYYFEGRYYRWYGGAWQFSFELGDGWRGCDAHVLPGRLSHRHSKHAKHSKRHRKHGGDHDDGDHRGRGHGDDDHDDDDDGRSWPGRRGRDRDD